MNLTNYLSCIAVVITLISNAAAKEDPRILEIRKWYNEVEGKKHATTSFSSKEADLPEVVKMKRYVSPHGKLQKIYVETGGDHGFQTTTYYFKDGKCFFVFEKLNRWKFTGKKLANGESEVVDIAAEYRYYFSKGTCIKCLGKQIELIGADELNALLKDKKNQVYKPAAAMNDYYKTATQLAKITTQKAFQKYFFDLD